MEFTILKERIKDDILLFTLICYGLGLLYSLVFYNHFHIPIIYYIELTDLLLVSIKTMAYILMFVVLFEFVFYSAFGDRIANLHNRIWKKNIYTAEETYAWLTNIILNLSLVFNYVTIKFASGSHQLVIATYLAPLITYYIAKYKVNKEMNIMYNTSFAVIAYALLLIVISDASAGFYLENKNKIHMSFIYENEGINTKDCDEQFYIGETSSTIFIYDKDVDLTNVYSKSDIKHLRYLE